MSISYYSGFDDSGQGQYWDEYYKWLEDNAPGRGKWAKSVIKDPANSPIATAALAGTTRAQLLHRQNATIDPEIAKNAPEVLAQQMNKADQDIAVEGNANFMNAIAGAQQAAAQMNQQRKMGIYGIQAAARGNELEERAKQMQAVKKENPWLAALKVGAGVAANFI